MKLEYFIEGGDFLNAGNASSSIKKVLKRLNVSSNILKRLVVALYEAEVNIAAHAYKGWISVDISLEKVLIELKDEGPGIPDINLAMQQGYSTASPEVREMGFGAGMGLPNIKANADDLFIESEVGVGTRLLITFYLSGN